LSAILGGHTNVIEGPFGAAYSAICGGQGNRTTARYATVTGGQHNIAGGEWSVVSGGQERSVDGDHDWRAGNLVQDE
jgi:hypothetical protein